MTQILDLECNTMFLWKDSVYELRDNSADPAVCICRFRTNAAGELYPVSPGWDEAFNPYADVEPGHITITFDPDHAQP